MDDSYHVLAGIEVHSARWITHNGKKNLRSAQMDIIVVCPKGVFMIEVKNWSDNYAKNNQNSLNPYEQTERAVSKCKHPKEMHDVCDGQLYCMDCNDNLQNLKDKKIVSK